MNAIEEIRRTLYESYKWLYEKSVENVKQCLAWARERRAQGHPGWAAHWLESANFSYRMAMRYKRSMKNYSN